MTKTGMFISFEGIDGSGKSTQARLLADRLRADGHDVILTREPGGSEGAEQIRNLVLNGPTDRWSPQTELLLFNAARRDHLERLIWPALEDGKIVVCDRFADSTRAYQGSTRGERRKLVDDLHNLMIGVEPDMTVLVDIDPNTGHSRATERNTGDDRFEGFGSDFQVTMRQAFLDMADASPNRFQVIDGDGTIDEVSDRIYAAVIQRLAQNADA